MTKKSSTTGKGFEYSLCKTLKADCFKGSLQFTTNAEKLQLNDKEKYLKLSEHERQYFDSQSTKIAKYIESEYFPNTNSATLDRFGDGHGTKGDPTDIQLKSDQETLNISLKHMYPHQYLTVIYESAPKFH